MEHACVSEHPELAVGRGRKDKAGSVFRARLRLAPRRACLLSAQVGSLRSGRGPQVRAEMVLGCAVAFGFPVKVPVLDVHAHCQADLAGRDGLRAVPDSILPAGRGARQAADRVPPATEPQHCRVLTRQHLGSHLHLNHAPVARVGGKFPTRRRSRFQGLQVVRVQCRNESVGLGPDADALGENVPIHRHRFVQVRPEQAIVFGIHASEIGA